MNRRIFNRMIRGLLAIVCIALSSCTYEERIDGRNPQALYVTFRIATSGVPGNADDGSWGDPYDTSEADDFENKILKDQFHVTFYDTESSNYVGRLEDIQPTDVVQSGTELQEFFQAELKLDKSISVEQLRTKNLKMMVVANVPEVTDTELKTAISSVDVGLGNLTYSYVGQPAKKDDENFPAIPMWGVCSPDLKNIAPGETTDLGKVDLLRAMAKVEVCVGTNTEGILDNVTVKSVTVSRVNTSGYGLPGKWNEIAKTTDLKFSETLRVPADVKTAEKMFNADDDGRTVVFYLPECKNGTAGNDEIKMTVTYAAGEEDKRGEILFCPYSGGSPVQNSERWDIVRNHHYKYEITSVSGVIKFKAKVHRWDEVETDEVVM